MWSLIKKKLLKKMLVHGQNIVKGFLVSFISRMLVQEAVRYDD